MSARIVTAKAPKPVRQPGWPRITRAVVGKSEPLSAMERAHIAANLAPPEAEAGPMKKPAHRTGH